MAFLLIADVPGALGHEHQIAVPVLGHVGAVIGNQILDRRIVADDVVVLVFRSRLGSERFVTLVNDRVDRVQNDRNLSLFKLIPIVID